MICALLVFQTSELPAPLGELSPWLDWLVTPRDEIFARLAAQRHRRFIKTHTPLDGVPLDSRVTYLVVARHPLDMAVSLYHQVDNLDRARIRHLTGRAEPAVAPSNRASPREWLLAWIDRPSVPQENLDSLPGVFCHLSDAWARRGAPNVALVHYDDLLRDVGGAMRRVATALEVQVSEDRWPDLVRAAGFERMRSRADQLAPDTVGVLKDRARFFRRGVSGEGRELLSRDEYAHYCTRAGQLAPSDLLEWLHRESRPRG